MILDDTLYILIVFIYHSIKLYYSVYFLNPIRSFFTYSYEKVLSN